MRKILALTLLVSALSGCQSSSHDRDGSASPSVNNDAEGSPSQVLAPSKCPKHSKLVNGKCTLQVESDDE